MRIVLDLLLFFFYLEGYGQENKSSIDNELIIIFYLNDLPMILCLCVNLSLAESIKIFEYISHQNKKFNCFELGCVCGFIAFPHTSTTFVKSWEFRFLYIQTKYVLNTLKFTIASYLVFIYDKQNHWPWTFFFLCYLRLISLQMFTFLFRR